MSGIVGLTRLAGDYAVPLPHPPLIAWPALDEVGDTRIAAVAAPDGYHLLDSAAAVLAERYADLVWIRLTAADSDPGVLLHALLGAVAQRDKAVAAGVGSVIADSCRRGDWPRAVRLAGEMLGAVTSAPAVLVLEGAEHLRRREPATLDLVVSALGPALRDQLSILFVSFAEWDDRRLSGYGPILGPRRLRLDRRAALGMAEALQIDLPPRALDRALAVTGGAAGALRAALSAGTVLGAERFKTAADRAAGGSDLLTDLGRDLLARLHTETKITLAGAVRLGVWHSTLDLALGHQAAAREGHQSGEQLWWLDLDDDWRQVIPAWRMPLRTAARPPTAPASLARLAAHLAHGRDPVRAIGLYREAGQLGSAVETVASISVDLVRAGCWTTIAQLGADLARPVPDEPRPTRQTGRHAREAWRRRWRLARIRPPGDSHGSPRLQGVDEATAPVGRSPRHAARPRVTATESGSPPPAAVPTSLTVHLLGRLDVVLGEQPVNRWVSGRGRAVFEYLVLHRHSTIRRERLMTVFWPDAAPEAARNSLHVAVHGLRQSLRIAAGDLPVLRYADHAYFIEPALEVWVDVEAFEERLQSARRQLARGGQSAARAELEAAIGLYQGEFLDDDPYEEWAHPTREQLRLAYLDGLHQLSSLRFDCGDYAGCVETSRTLLACDGCREDSHRLLMRCYSRLDQPQLALRQFHSCVSVLHHELQLPPAAATVQLAQRIRRREQV